MPLSLPLPSPLGHHYYETAQLAAFAVYVGLLLGQGYRRGYAARVWLPLVAATTLALVLGCQLVFLQPAQWLRWLHGDAATIAALPGGPRSIVGGAWGSFLVVLVLRRPLGFRGWQVFDAFAGPLCWALAVQSVGCGLAGCCWGEATAGGWGVAYGPGTPAYAAQLAQGLLPAGATHSLALVPTQLFQLLACAGAGLALHLLRRRAASWPAGSRYLLGMGLLCLGRLVVETWRDPAGEPLLGEVYTLAGLPLRGLQWLMLAEVLVLLGSWAWWVRRIAAPEPAPAPHPVAPALVAGALLLVTSRLDPATLAWAEVVTLQALLLLVLLAEGRTWWVTLGRGVPRLARLPLAGLLGGSVLLGTAQAPAPQQHPQAEAGSSRQLTLSGGYLPGYYEEQPQTTCSRSPYVYGHTTRAGGAEVNYQWKPELAPGFFNAVGGGAWLGSEGISLSAVQGAVYSGTLPVSNNYLTSHPLFDAHLYAERHRVISRGRLFTYRFGLHLGQLGRGVDYGSTAGNPYNSFSSSSIRPELMVAFGKPVVFGQFDAGYGVENALGNYLTRAGAGTNFGHPGGGTLLVGVAVPLTVAGSTSADANQPAMGFASAQLRLPLGTANALVLEPYLATNFDQQYQFSVKLHYRLGLR